MVTLFPYVHPTTGGFVGTCEFHGWVSEVCESESDALDRVAAHIHWRHPEIEAA